MVYSRIRRLIYGLALISLCLTSLSLWHIVSSVNREGGADETRHRTRRIEPGAFRGREEEKLLLDKENKLKIERRWNNIKLMGQTGNGPTTGVRVTTPLKSRTTPTLSGTTTSVSEHTQHFTNEIELLVNGVGNDAGDRKEVVSQELLSRDTPSEDTPTTDTPSKDTPTTDTPSKDVPIADTPSKDTPTTDTPSKDTPTTNTPSKDTPSKDTPSKDTPTADTPSKDTPTTDTPSKDTPTTDTPSKDTPTTDTPSRDENNQRNAQNSHFSNRRPSVSMSTATPRSDTPSSSPITHFATREIPLTLPLTYKQKLELKYGVTLTDCRIMYKLVDRKCHSYENMRFLRPDEANRTVALASFPGSGNTWLRLMLEEVTGVFTGSVYNDKTLKCTGFLAEGFKGRPTNEMVAIKTHEGNGDWDAAIFLIRNPYKAIMSYFTWMATGSHTKTRKLFKIPNRIFDNCLNRWQWLWEYYVLNQTHPFPVHIIEYENLIDNLEVELKKMVVFLNQTIQPDKIECLIDQNNDNYQRKKHRSENPFSSEQTSKMEKWISDNEHILKKLNVQYEKWKWEQSPDNQTATTV